MAVGNGSDTNARTVANRHTLIVVTRRISLHLAKDPLIRILVIKDSCFYFNKICPSSAPFLQAIGQ
jgi:hypothetical protein